MCRGGGGEGQPGPPQRDPGFSVCRRGGLLPGVDGGFWRRRSELRPSWTAGEKLLTVTAAGSEFVFLDRSEPPESEHLDVHKSYSNRKKSSLPVDEEFNYSFKKTVTKTFN